MLAVSIVHVWSRLLTVGHLGNCLQLVKNPRYTQNSLNERFYEKVMKVKADVAASLIPSELTKSY